MKDWTFATFVFFAISFLGVLYRATIALERIADNLERMNRD
jgi:hypothetical protein